MTGAGPLPVAHLVADYCVKQGAGTAFVVVGGASLHLIHAFASHDQGEVIPMHHEQSAAMAADGFSRSANKVGVTIATSGPGATNLITGIAGAYYDSVPIVCLTGQVSTSRMVGNTGVRQIGFQETPIVEMVQGITKFAVTIRNPQELRFVLERAFFEAQTGRPGPVLIDIPDDIQRAIVDWDSLESFRPPIETEVLLVESKLDQLLELLNECSQPVIVGGWGIHLSGCELDFLELVDSLNIPVVLTWAALGLLPRDHPLRLGPFGTHGSRAANFAVQNSDLVLSIGSRLDTKATGSPISTFARSAKKVAIDIDQTELDKFSEFGLEMDLTIRSDAGSFIRQMLEKELPSFDNPQWTQRNDSRRQAVISYDETSRKIEGLNPYYFAERLNESAPSKTDFFVDTGCAIAWLTDSFAPTTDQRLFHDFNNTAMGWSIPASIGGGIGDRDRQQVCVVGDGSIMMSIQDLASFQSLSPHAKVILLDNSGYSMIRQTQEQWLESNYVASSVQGGLVFPDFELIAASFGFQYKKINTDEQIEPTLKDFWTNEHPIFLHVVVPESARIAPQVVFGRPIEDMGPLLPRDLFMELMDTQPLAVSMSGIGT